MYHARYPHAEFEFPKNEDLNSESEFMVKTIGDGTITSFRPYLNITHDGKKFVVIKTSKLNHRIHFENYYLFPVHRWADGVKIVKGEFTSVFNFAKLVGGRKLHRELCDQLAKYDRMKKAP